MQFWRSSGAILLRRHLLCRYANQLRRLEGTQSGNGSKAALPELPQLYLNGQRIGSLAEMKALNEDGQLSARLDEFRMEYIYDAGEVDCAACGGKRFVVCSTCSGTKRGRVRTIFPEPSFLRDERARTVEGERGGTPRFL